jgi:flagellar biosynthesis protein FliR
MEVYVTQLVLFLLLFARITSLIVVAPVVGHTAVPVQVKVGLGLFFSFVFYPLAARTAPEVDVRLLALVLMALKEVAVGLVIGFAAGVLFAGVQGAGELVGFELGFSIATIFDPENGQSNPLVGQFFYLAASLVFLMLNGHHFAIEALQLSYAAIPVNGLQISGMAADRMVALTGTVLLVAVKLASPVIVAGFLVNLAMAVLSRVAPQMNVFVLSFPVKIAVVLVVLMTAGPMMIYVFKKLLSGFEDNVLELVRAL